MRKFKNFIKVSLIVVVVLVSLSTATYAAWWGTTGYEWCFAKGITPIMTRKQMNQTVTQADFYAIVLRYLNLKEVKPGRKVIQTIGDTSQMNSALLGMIDDINDYIVKGSLTPNEYRQVITYAEHAEDIVQKQQNLLTKNSVKSFSLYMSLAKYKAATLIDNSTYRSQEIAKHGNVKFSEIFKYGINPYYGNITRKEFLVLMFSLLSDQGVSEEEIITQYNESGVLEGYEGDLMLEKEIKYSEIFAFLRRFETFDFNPIIEEEKEE